MVADLGTKNLVCSTLQTLKGNIQQQRELLAKEDT